MSRSRVQRHRHAARRHSLRLNHHVIIRNNTLDHNGNWGILTGFSDDLLIENNVASRSQVEHGIYVSNSGDRPVIRNNTSGAIGPTAST